MYEDRLRKAIFRSPKGNVFSLDFEDVSRSLKKKVFISEAPASSSASIQDLGNEAQIINFDCFFTGNDYDITADSFFSALSERGTASFQHPRFGDISVIPSSWSQSENFVEGLGRANFKIEFLKVNKKAVFPNVTKATDSDILEKSSSAIAESIAKSSGIVPENAEDFSKIKGFTEKSVSEYFINFKNILSISESYISSASSMAQDILDNIDTLINDPINLYTKISSLLAIPATITTKCTQKIIAYLNQINSISQFVPESYAQARSSMEQLFYCLGFSSQSSVTGDFSSRADVSIASDTYGTILSAFFSKVESVESLIPGFSTDSETTSNMVNSVSISREALIDRAFSLKAEKRITLKTSRTPIDFVFEVFGNLDYLDSFIEINKFSGNDIVLIPKGREVLYYG